MLRPAGLEEAAGWDGRLNDQQRSPGKAVSLDAVSVAFRLADGSSFTAVQQATLDVADGEFVAVVGPTGCGKSTLLNLIAGLLKPAAGAVRIYDAALTRLNLQSGYLFQADALFPWKTVLENVEIGLEISGTARREAREAALKWLARVGLGGFETRYPHMLSDGQRSVSRSRKC